MHFNAFVYKINSESVSKALGKPQITNKNDWQQNIVRYTCISLTMVTMGVKSNNFSL